MRGNSAPLRWQARETFVYFLILWFTCFVNNVKLNLWDPHCQMLIFCLLQVVQLHHRWVNHESHHVELRATFLSSWEMDKTGLLHNRTDDRTLGIQHLGKWVINLLSPWLSPGTLLNNVTNPVGTVLLFSDSQRILTGWPIFNVHSGSASYLGQTGNPPCLQLWRTSKIEVCFLFTLEFLKRNSLPTCSQHP